MWFWHQKNLLIPNKDGQTFFDHCLIQKTTFCEDKIAVFVKNCTNIFIFSQSAISTKKQHIFFSQKAFKKKAMIQKCKLHLLSALVWALVLGPLVFEVRL
jgi:hypothetical protein